MVLDTQGRPSRVKGDLTFVLMKKINFWQKIARLVGVDVYDPRMLKLRREVSGVFFAGDFDLCDSLSYLSTIPALETVLSESELSAKEIERRYRENRRALATQLRTTYVSAVAEMIRRYPDTGLSKDAEALCHPIWKAYVHLHDIDASGRYCRRGLWPFVRDPWKDIGILVQLTSIGDLQQWLVDYERLPSRQDSETAKLIQSLRSYGSSTVQF